MGKVKIKTKKSAARRYKITKNGKVVYPKQGRRHLMTNKSSKRKRQLRSGGVLNHCEAKRARQLMPYV